jgi:hypothetical protein
VVSLKDGSVDKVSQNQASVKEMFLKNEASYKEALLGHPKDNTGTHQGHGAQETIRAID